MEPKVDSSIQLVLEAIDIQATSGKYWIGAKSEGGASFTWTGDNSMVNNDNWAFGFPISALFKHTYFSSNGRGKKK